MKKPLTLTLLSSGILASSSLYANTTGDFIRQHDYLHNTTKDIYINGPETGSEKTGTLGVNSVLPVGKGGAKFELFAVDLQTGQLIPEPLDSKLVGLFADAKITIESGDPYEKDGVHRTRADMSFYYSVEGLNLSNDPADPEYLKSIYAERLYGEYTSEDRLPFNKERGYTVVNGKGWDSNSYQPAATYLYENKPITESRHKWTGIPNPSDTEDFKQRGEETIRAYAQPADGSNWEVIGEKKIQIWPVVSSAGYLDLANGNRQALPEEQDIYNSDEIPVFSSMPSFTYVLEDLYPTSNTYMVVHRVNESNSQLPAIEENLLNEDDRHDNTTILINTVTPQNKTFFVPESEWVESEIKPGRYRIQARTITPFNTEESEVILTFDYYYQPTTTINVNGKFTTSE